MGLEFYSSDFNYWLLLIHHFLRHALLSRAGGPDKHAPLNLYTIISSNLLATCVKFSSMTACRLGYLTSLREWRKFINNNVHMFSYKEKELIFPLCPFI